MQRFEIEMTDEEMRILVSSLEKYLSELRMEIANTDREEFRKSLKDEKRIIYKFIEMVEEKTNLAV